MPEGGLINTGDREEFEPNRSSRPASISQDESWPPRRARGPVKSLDLGEFDIAGLNGDKPKGDPHFRKSQNPFLENEGYAEQLIKKLEQKASPAEQVAEWSLKKRMLESRLTQEESMKVKFLADSQKRIGSLQKVIELLSLDEHSENQSVLDEASKAIVELENQASTRRAQMELSALATVKEIESIDTKIRALGGESHEVVKSAASASEQEKSQELIQLNKYLSSLKRSESDYEEHIVPLISAVEKTLGSFVYLRPYSQRWHELGYDPSGKLDQSEIRKTLERFHRASKIFERYLTPIHNGQSNELEGQQVKGYMDGLHFNPEGTKFTNIEDRKVIAAYLVDDYRTMKKKIDWYQAILEARKKNLEEKTSA